MLSILLVLHYGLLLVVVLIFLSEFIRFPLAVPVSLLFIAAMLALDARWLDGAGIDRCRTIAGMIGLAGPYDFLPLSDPRLMEVFGPGPAGADTGRSSPTGYVNLVTKKPRLEDSFSGSLGREYQRVVGARCRGLLDSGRGIRVSQSCAPGRVWG